MAPIPPTPDPSWPIPKLNLQVQDLGHPGVDVFLKAVNPKEVLELAIRASYRWLHTEDDPPAHLEEFLVVLRSMEGVAYATGSSTHKQIHFSLDYINGIDKSRIAEEITGVLVHEAVHCFQYDGHGSCPGGLVEGMADYVRLQEGYGPPHWHRKGEGSEWDAGYDTTAYFLEWIENRYGVGTVRELNHCMKDTKYHRRVFKELTGRPVRKLWRLYCAHLKGEQKAKEEEGADEVADDAADDDEYDIVQVDHTECEISKQH